MNIRTAIVCASVTLGLCAAAGGASAQTYTPQVFNPATDVGIDFSTIPAGASTATITTALQKADLSNVFLAGQYTDGHSLWLTTKSPSWLQSGFMSSPSGCSAGHGYGHFHWRAQAGYNAKQATQGPGVNLILWDSNNLDVQVGNLNSKWPGGQETNNEAQNTVGEVDVLEQWPTDDNTSFSTFHWVDSTNTKSPDQQQFFLPMIYPAGQSGNTMNDYDVYWGPGYLDVYVDNIFQHGIEKNLSTSQVPLDAAHGGCNYSLGAQVVIQDKGADKLPTVQLLVANAWWDPSTSPGSTPVMPNTIGITAPTGTLQNGTAFTLPGTINYTLPSSLYLIVNNGTPFAVTPTPTGTGTFTVQGPASIPAGNDTIEVTSIDGSVVSNVLDVAVNTSGGNAPAAPSGSVPQPSPFLAQVQDIPVTLNASVTSAAVDWHTTGQPVVGASDSVAVTGIGTANPIAPGVVIDHPGTSSTMWLSVNGGAFVSQFTAVPGTPSTAPTPVLTLNQAGPYTAGGSCSLSGTSNFAMTSTQVLVNGTPYGETQYGGGGGSSGTATYTVPCPSALTATAGAISVQVSSGSPAATSNAVTVTVNPLVLAANLPSPFYTGGQQITGTGGITGLQLEAISGNAAYNTPGGSGWVNATVNADGTWTAVLSEPTAGIVEHIYAAQGGSSTVVDLIDGTPQQAPSLTGSIVLSAPAAITYGNPGFIPGTINYTPVAPVVWIDGSATALKPSINNGVLSLPVPSTLVPGLHTEQLKDGATASSNVIVFLVDYNGTLLAQAVDAELASTDAGAAMKAKIDAELGIFIGLGH